MNARQKSSSGTAKPAALDVYDQLRDMIVRGSLAPGAPLIERQLAARLGVSRASLRAGLQRLEQEGFVRSTRAGKYSRAVVAPLTIADMEEIYALIAVLDGVGARLAAALPDEQREVLAGELQEWNDRLAEALGSSTGEFTPIYEIDRQLHSAYVERAGGPRLRRAYDAIRSQGERYGRAYASAMGYATMMMGEISTSVGEHQAIIDAIRAGDADAAEHAAVRNWRNAAVRFRQVIAVAGERGEF